MIHSKSIFGKYFNSSILKYFVSWRKKHTTKLVSGKLLNSKQNNFQGFLSVMISTVSPVLALLAFFSEETDRNRINSKMDKCCIMIILWVRERYMNHVKAGKDVKLFISLALILLYNKNIKSTCLVGSYQSLVNIFIYVPKREHNSRIIYIFDCSAP